MIDGLCLSISPHSTLSSLSNAYNNINTLNYNKRDFSSYTFSFQLLMFSFAFLKQHELELWIFKTKCTVIFVVLFFFAMLSTCLSDAIVRALVISHLSDSSHVHILATVIFYYSVN